MKKEDYMAPAIEVLDFYSEGVFCTSDVPTATNLEEWEYEQFNGWN